MGRLRKVQEVMSSRSLSSARAISIAQHQVAREEWRKSESAGSNKPRCSTTQPQANSEKNTIKDINHDQYCREVTKTIEEGAMRELKEEEMEKWTGPIHYISMFHM